MLESGHAAVVEVAFGLTSLEVAFKTFLIVVFFCFARVVRSFRMFDKLRLTWGELLWVYLGPRSFQLDLLPAWKALSGLRSDFTEDEHGVSAVAHSGRNRRSRALLLGCKQEFGC